MKILGLNITRAKRHPVPGPWRKSQKAVSPVSGGWRSRLPVIWESFAGAWQQNVEVKVDTAMSFHAVFACQTLIASDIAKLRIKLMSKDADGIWAETKNASYSPVLRKPNHFQTTQQFLEGWVLSKLNRGNAYILKQRDGRGVVKHLYALDPNLVTPLVSSSGEVFYQLQADHLSGIAETVTVPAREIIHDRFNCLFHPLIGISPLFANGLAAMQGLAIQNTSTLFFQNGTMPGGILTAPGHIEDETATRLKADWEEKFGGRNRGKIAVLGDGLKFEQMATTPVDAQLIEQLKWSAEVVCSTYHVPPYKIGIGQMPGFNNVQALNTEYYSQCLQALIEAIEICLDEGLGTGEALGTELDTDALLRMDSVTQMQVIKEGRGTMTVNEGRRKLNLPKVTGGDTVYLQEQDHSLEALAKRDASDDPFGKGAPAPTEQPQEPEERSIDLRATKNLFARRRAA